jgi:hypothetical protein
MIYRNKDKISGLLREYYLSGLQVINEWGETIGYPVLNMSIGGRKWCVDGKCEDYLPVGEKANVRLVR